MIELIIAAICYTCIGLLIYYAAKDTHMLKREQLKYSIFWPWLFIATVGCIVWDFFFAKD